jgi:hypothetical protein
LNLTVFGFEYEFVKARTKVSKDIGPFHTFDPFDTFVLDHSFPSERRKSNRTTRRFTSADLVNPVLWAVGDLTNERLMKWHFCEKHFGDRNATPEISNVNESFAPLANKFHCL